jgi:hypothetical protein
MLDWIDFLQKIAREYGIPYSAWDVFILRYDEGRNFFSTKPSDEHFEEWLSRRQKPITLSKYEKNWSDIVRSFKVKGLSFPAKKSLARGEKLGNWLDEQYAAYCKSYDATRLEPSRKPCAAINEYMKMLDYVDGDSEFELKLRKSRMGASAFLIRADEPSMCRWIKHRLKEKIPGSRTGNIRLITPKLSWKRLNYDDLWKELGISLNIGEAKGSHEIAEAIIEACQTKTQLIFIQDFMHLGEENIRYFFSDFWHPLSKYLSERKIGPYSGRCVLFLDERVNYEADMMGVNKLPALIDITQQDVCSWMCDHKELLCALFDRPKYEQVFQSMELWSHVSGQPEDTIDEICYQFGLESRETLEHYWNLAA